MSESVPSTAYRDVRYEVQGAVAHIELHRPEALNAWTPEMGRELLDAVRRAATDDTVRAVLITGAGRAFCAGADVKNAREQTSTGEADLTTRLREIYNPIVLAVRAAPKPFVAAVHGACAGLGASLALACDLLVAAEDAYLLLAFIRIGVMPDGGATTFLAERVGLSRAAELCMLGDRLSAARALDWGLVNAVHPADELLAAGRALAERLAAAPTAALASVKTALNAAAHPNLATHLEMEADLQQRHAATADYAEGRAAFAEKRQARFTGQ
ncbi:enoyl-CoA hydratase/isomerase family protein [Pseudonocardia sp. RS010]|uniref:enoyl-CoA hydratase/isomerase family protein n=1 Tax=Pseudonocardia sp. RS010 TaxID=3385979 RepID=UPI0039A2E988